LLQPCDSGLNLAHSNNTLKRMRFDIYITVAP